MKDDKNTLEKAISDNKELAAQVAKDETEGQLKMAIFYQLQYEFQKEQLELQREEAKKIKGAEEQKQRMQQLAQTELQKVIPLRDKAQMFLDFHNFLKARS